MPFKPRVQLFFLMRELYCLPVEDDERVSKSRESPVLDGPKRRRLSSNVTNLKSQSWLRK